MPDAKSGRVHILHQLAVPGGVAAKDAGNHLLLSLTRRSERCRSGSEIPSPGLHERQGAERRSRGVEGCGIRDELIIACSNSRQSKFARPTRVAYSFDHPERIFKVEAAMPARRSKLKSLPAGRRLAIHDPIFFFAQGWRRHHCTF
jgi:hypothetical protein